MSVPSGFWLVTKMPTFIVLSLVRGSGQPVPASRPPRGVARWIDDALRVAVHPFHGVGRQEVDLGRRVSVSWEVIIHGCPSTCSGQYRPPSLRWSQLTTFSGTILSTTRLGALASAPGC